MNTASSTCVSAWESVQSEPSIWPDLRNGLSVSDRENPCFTGVNGPLMARRLDHVEGDLPLFRPDISQVAADRASVMRCRWSLALAVGRCCCCHRCCQPGVGPPVASRPAPCRGSDLFRVRSPPRLGLPASSQVATLAMLSGSGRDNPRPTTRAGTWRARP